MRLNAERAGLYVRALQAGLQALAPHEDHVPLAAALAHLRAMDPLLSGDVLSPAETDDRTGMPAFPWMERTVAEAEMARAGNDGDDPADGELARVETLDPALGRRLRSRRALHRHLRHHAVLPVVRLSATLRRRRPRETYTLAYDRLAPGGLWIRVRCEVESGPGGIPGDLLAVRPDDRVAVDAGLRHVITRHLGTPLLALRSQLVAVTGARVTRLARSAVGPFWYPGVEAPAHVPPALLSGLLLHLSTEVVAGDVHTPAHRDPWLPAPADERPPEGQGIFRERRFAATPPLMEPLRRWAAAAGCEVVAEPLRPP